MRRAVITSLVAAATAVASLSGLAAPVNTELPSEAAGKPDPGVLPSAATTGNSTIDQLIQMQPQSAGVQFNERARPSGGNLPANGRPRDNSVTVGTPAALPAAATRRPEPPEPPKPALFGAGATPMVQAARTATVNPTASSDSGAGATRSPSRAASAEPLPRWLMWPREVIEYVRENRGTVLGSVAGLLALAWSASLMFSRRRG